MGMALITDIHRYLSKNKSPAYSQPASDWFLPGAACHEGLGWLFQILGE